jgi:hypothetical protein
MKVLEADSNELDQLDTHHTEKTDQAAYQAQNITKQATTQATTQVTTQATTQAAQSTVMTAQ